MAVNINIPSEVTQTITDGVTKTAPSENAVHDALSLKANTADLADVATTGDYDDLINQPSIPAAQVNSDWSAVSGVAEILNKPSIPSIAGLVPDSRQLTINGVSYDLTADRSWTIAATASTLQHAVKAGEIMTKGQAVYVSSADGTNMIVTKASNATEATSSKTMGLIVQNLANNGQGYVITEGLLAGLNTAAAVDGDPVWLGTGGNLIFGLANKPSAPAHLVFIGIVTRANVSNGEIFVRVQNGFELQELHNVAITSVADNNLLQYDSATSLWKNESLATAGIQPTLTSGTNIKTINGTSVLGAGDLVISGGGGIAVGTTAVTSGTVGRVFFQATGDVVQQSANLFWDNTNGRLNLGAVGTLGARLDIKAPGALSTDIAFRVRNSADSATILQVNGVGQVWANGKGFQSQNTAFGQLSLNSCTTGNNNTAFGYNSLAAVTTATTNTGFGSGTLQLTTGEGNTGIGFNSGRLITTGTYNTCIGYEAGSNGAPTAGVYIGNSPGNTSVGSNVVAIGNLAAQGLTSGSGGVAIGNSAKIGTTGQHNISLGQSSGSGLTTGSFNIHLGYRSVASGVATGNYNTLIGGDSVIGDVSNNAILSDAQGNQAIRKDANHNVLLGREVALATNATNGFAYLPTCAGVPTGVPAASFTGKAPVVIDSTNNKMYIYTNAAWVALN